MLYPYRRHPLKTLQWPAAGTRPPPPAEVPLVPPRLRLMWQMCCSSCTHSKHAPEDVHVHTHKTHTRTNPKHRVLEPLFKVIHRAGLLFLAFALCTNQTSKGSLMNVVYVFQALYWAVILCLLSTHRLHNTFVLYISLRVLLLLSQPVNSILSSETVLGDSSEKKTVLRTGLWLDYLSPLVSLPVALSPPSFS